MLNFALKAVSNLKEFCALGLSPTYDKLCAVRSLVVSTSCMQGIVSSSGGAKMFVSVVSWKLVPRSIHKKFYVHVIVACYLSSIYVHAAHCWSSLHESWYYHTSSLQEGPLSAQGGGKSMKISYAQMTFIILLM